MYSITNANNIDKSDINYVLIIIISKVDDKKKILR